MQTPLPQVPSTMSTSRMPNICGTSVSATVSRIPHTPKHEEGISVPAGNRTERGVGSVLGLVANGVQLACLVA
jgi:hypothetical protein